MLSLARKVEEDVYIKVPPSRDDQYIAIKVMRVSRNRVQLGFVADDDVTIWRDDYMTREAFEQMRTRRLRDESRGSD